MMNGFKDWMVATVCVLVAAQLVIYAWFPESYGRAAARIVKAYQIEMASP